MGTGSLCSRVFRRFRGVLPQSTSSLLLQKWRLLTEQSGRKTTWVPRVWTKHHFVPCRGTSACERTLRPRWWLIWFWELSTRNMYPKLNPVGQPAPVVSHAPLRWITCSRLYCADTSTQFEVCIAEPKWCRILLVLISWPSGKSAGIVILRPRVLFSVVRRSTGLPATSCGPQWKLLVYQ